MPGAKTAGKEIPSTDESLRRTCSWNALKGYDYRWLDVSFEINESDQAAADRRTRSAPTEKSGGGAVPGLGDEAYSVVNLTTEDKQQTREGVVFVRASNALVVITYNGSDFESKKAPSTDEINKGAIKAAKEAVAALEDAPVELPPSRHGTSRRHGHPSRSAVLLRAAPVPPSRRQPSAPRTAPATCPGPPPSRSRPAA